MYRVCCRKGYLSSFATPVLLAAVVVALLGPPRAARAQGDTVYVGFEVMSNWGTAFNGRISITNNAGWVIWDWQLEFDFAHTIDNIWDARIVDYSAGRYTIAAVDAAWEDGDISPGETATFSFIALPGGDVETPTNGELNDWPIAFNNYSPAPPPLEPLDPPAWPGRFFAPYVDTVLWPPFDLAGTAQSEGVRFFTLAFIVAHGAGECTPSWGGYYTIDSGYMLLEINALRELGGDVIVSFGGAAGIELAAACDDVDQLTSAYQSVIDAYNLTHIDFDIEGALVAEPESIARRSAAIAALQAQAASEGRELHVCLTLPVLPTGLTQDGVNVLQSALDHGVDIGGVNVMAMDYGDAVAPQGYTMMGEYAIEAATNLFSQLQTLYSNAGIPKTDEELWEMIGVTPMIGLNDVVTEIFWQEDAYQLLAFAEAQDIGMLSFWSANRDNECPGGETGYVSPSCSSILQEPFEFTRIFLPFTCCHPADLNGDGQIDLEDFNIFTGCMNGPQVDFPAGCDAADLDADGDVDFRDFTVFQNAFGMD